ncbi:MAG TPA: 3'-5' exonuclease [Actinophytocola sp.]|nr:3'-5' exonuclease [Actinophytocola sp.]
MVAAAREEGIDMARKVLDQVLVIDVESTCWDGPPPEGQRGEIIEIGVCALDVGSLERVGKESILVRPEHSVVSSFCTELTTITAADVAAGVTFAEACAVLRKEAEGRVWASYGDYDRRQFERQCADVGVRYPFGIRHLNVKSLFALGRGLTDEVGMDEALRMAGLPLEGTHHRGVDDAWNIAALLARLLGAHR